MLPHHIETDIVEEFPVEKLKQIKNNHEKLFLKSDFKIDESELMKLSVEMERFWSGIDYLNKVEHKYVDSGLAMDVEGSSGSSI